MTFNIAHGRRRVPHQALLNARQVRRNLSALAGLIGRTEADIVALQEADGPSVWSGNFDHVATLAELAGMDTHYRGDHNPFGFGRHTLASGTALMSTTPMREPVSYPFDSSWRCTKGFVVATVSLPTHRGQEVDVVSVHLDFLAPAKRREQIRMMLDVLVERDRPLVVLGDLNCCWRREPDSIRLLMERLGLRAFEPNRHLPTYPAYRPRRRLDWILATPELEFVGHRRVPIKLSDHLGVIADLRLRPE